MYLHVFLSCSSLGGLPFVCVGVWVLQLESHHGLGPLCLWCYIKSKHERVCEHQ